MAKVTIEPEIRNMKLDSIIFTKTGQINGSRGFFIFSTFGSETEAENHSDIIKIKIRSHLIHTFKGGKCGKFSTPAFRLRLT